MCIFPLSPALCILEMYAKDMRQKYKIMSSITLLLQGKKSRCPSIENQLQKLWNIHTIESYEAVRRKEKENQRGRETGREQTRERQTKSELEKEGWKSTKEKRVTENREMEKRRKKGE